MLLYNYLLIYKYIYIYLAKIRNLGHFLRFLPFFLRFLPFFLAFLSKFWVFLNFFFFGFVYIFTVRPKISVFLAKNWNFWGNIWNLPIFHNYVFLIKLFISKNQNLFYLKSKLIISFWVHTSTIDTVLFLNFKYTLTCKLAIYYSN